METEKKERPINEHLLKISGQIAIAGPLDRANRYTLAFEADVQAVKFKDNEDGTDNAIYSLHATGPAIIKDDRGAKIPSKDKRSKSQRLRGLIWRNAPDGIEPDLWYQQRMDQVLHFWPDIENLLDRLDKK